MDGPIRTGGFHKMAGVVVLLTLALAGCGGGGGSAAPGGVSASGGGSTAPGGSGGGSAAPGGTGTYTATAVVTAAGVPMPGVTVTLSGAVDPNTQNPTGVIAAKVTDPQGQAAFPGLIKGMNYCFTASLTNSTGSHQAVVCSNTGETIIRLKL